MISNQYLPTSDRGLFIPQLVTIIPDLFQSTEHSLRLPNAPKYRITWISLRQPLRGKKKRRFPKYPLVN